MGMRNFPGCHKGQSATQLCSDTTYCPMRGQGATEYLVLLAVVLIVALVSVALLGFFPGMASDSKITQSQIYWRSASPISIVDIQARGAGGIYIYMKVKNSGNYPIRITGIIGSDGQKITQFDGYDCGASNPPGWSNISNYFYLGPGEEKYFSEVTQFGGCDWNIYATTGSTSGVSIGSAAPICQNSKTTPGVLDYKSFGFEYIQYIDNTQLTKRQFGKELIVKCLPSL